MIKCVLTGHSRGIGAALVQQLVGKDIPVLGVSRHVWAEEARTVPPLLTQAALDLSDSAALLAWCQSDALPTFLAGAEQVLLINNAGILSPVGDLSWQRPDAVQQTVQVNVAAPLMLTSAVCTAAPQQAERRIVHVSSGAARQAYAGWSVYGASKAALDHHARCVAADGLAGVRICSVAPGVVDTDMQGQVRGTPQAAFPLRERFEQLWQNDQLRSPSAVAEQLLDYLLSPQFGEQAVADLRDLA